MQIIDAPTTAGRYAIASRNIPAGELIHVSLPLISMPTYNQLKSGTVCIGCITRLNNNRGTSSSCKHCGAVFCSQICASRFMPFHVTTGECAVARMMLATPSVHSLRGSDADDLMAGAALIARAIVEGFVIPPSSSSSSAAQQQQQQLPAGASNDTVITAVVSANAAIAVQEEQLPQEQQQQQQQQQQEQELLDKVALNDDNNNTNDDALIVSVNATSADGDGSDDAVVEERAEEEDDDDDDGNDVDDIATQQQQQRKSHRGGKKNNKNKNCTKNNNNNNKKKRTTTTNTRPICDGSQQQQQQQQDEASYSRRIAADVAFAESKPRTCIAVKYPDFMKSQQQKNNIMSQLIQQWNPLTSEENIDLRRSANNNINDSTLVSDIQTRAAAANAAPRPTFVDFCNMISNADVLPRSTLQKYETLRRRLVSAAAKMTTSSSSSSSSFYPTSIDEQFFYHLMSTYYSNCFGLYDSGEEPEGFAMFPSASYFNHSCERNLVRRNDRSAAAFYALRPIAAGESLCITYASGKSHAERFETLLEHWRFVCRCSLCEKAQSSSSSSSAAAAQQPQQQLKNCNKCFLKKVLRPILAAGDTTTTTTTVAGYECESCFEFSKMCE